MMPHSVSFRNELGRKKAQKAQKIVSIPNYYQFPTITKRWYPDRYSYKDGLRHGTTTLLTGFGINVLREFVIRR